MPEPVRLPSHAALAWPALVVLRRSSDGLSNREMESAVADELDLSPEQRQLTRTPRSRRTLLAYRLAWSRTLLKGMDAIVNVAPARWAITEHGQQITEAQIKAATDEMLAKIGQR